MHPCKPPQPIAINREDIHVIQPITMAQAVLGGKISVATLTGDTLLTVPAATQEGDKLILRQRGIKKPQSAMKGDQFVHFHICIPKYVQNFSCFLYAYQ